MNEPNGEKKQSNVAFGIVIGAGFGVALGVVMMNILDHPGFFAVGIAIGVSLGTTIGLTLDQRGGRGKE